MEDKAANEILGLPSEEIIGKARLPRWSSHGFKHSLFSCTLVRLDGHPALAFACPGCLVERQFVFIYTRPLGYMAFRSLFPVQAKFWRYLSLSPSFLQENKGQCSIHLWLDHHQIGIISAWSKQMAKPYDTLLELNRTNKCIDAHNYFDAPNKFSKEDLELEISIALDIPNLMKMKQNLSPEYEKDLSPIITEKIEKLKTDPFLEQPL